MIIYHFASTPSQSSTSSQTSTPSQSCPTGQIINKEYGICGNFDFSKLLQEYYEKKESKNVFLNKKN